MGDRLGPRRVLTRIVVWWSGFTALTGTMTSFYPLLLTRFLFGAGEAGAFPNASVVVARWFPPTQRATMSGVNLMASQVGGAIAPFLVAADPDALRLAHVVLRVWRGGHPVGGGVVRVVPRLARGDARAAPASVRRHASSRRHAGSRESRVPVARCFPVADGVGAAGAGLLLRLRLQLLPDLVSHVPGQGPRLQRDQPAALGAAVRGGRRRESRRRRRQRRAGPAARPPARPAADRRRRPGGRRPPSPWPRCSPSTRSLP